MKVSVIVTTHEWSRYGDYCDAIHSIEAQTHDPVELVCPIESDPDMVTATRSIADGGRVTDTDSDCMAAARNAGAETASGDVYAFIDDDCVADPHWVEKLVEAFDAGAVAAGGPAIPDWPTERPWWLPREFDWLVGAGPYHESRTEVRNTYGCNIAFDAGVFDRLGGFDESLGKGADINQGEEAELCQRLWETLSERVAYRPDAVVRHKISEEQCRPLPLLRRAYRQGAAKRHVGVGDEEQAFLVDSLRLLTSPRSAPATVGFTSATALGYLTGSRGTA